MSYEALSETLPLDLGHEILEDSASGVPLHSEKNTVLKSHGRPPWSGDFLRAYDEVNS
jgi:hypothetical protein